MRVAEWERRRTHTLICRDRCPTRASKESDLKLLSISPPVCASALPRGHVLSIACIRLTRKTTREGLRAQSRLILVHGNPGASKTALISGLHAMRLRADAAYRGLAYARSKALFVLFANESITEYQSENESVKAPGVYRHHRICDIRAWMV